MADAAFGVFLGALAVQLVTAMTERTRARQITKPVLMPLLLLFYWLKADAPTFLVMLALVLSTMGDIFLLWPGKQGTFIAGLLSFLTAHVLYIVVFAGAAARANGLPERTITMRYALRNAMPPIVTITGLQIGFLLGGAVFTEYIFAWPGIGDAIYKGILARDIAVVQGAVLVVAVWFVLVNLAVDVINLALDPRSRG